MAAEYLVGSKAPATPVELLVEVRLRGNAEGDEPRRLIRALQPPVSDHGLIILPPAGKFVILEDIGGLTNFQAEFCPTIPGRSDHSPTGTITVFTGGNGTSCNSFLTSEYARNRWWP